MVFDLVDAANDALDIQVLWFCGLHDGLVVDREVVENVRVARIVFPVHPLDPVLEDVLHFVGVSRVVGDEAVVGGGKQVGVPVKVLQAFTGQRRATRGCSDHEAARKHVGRRPELVAGALEPEH